MSAEDSNKNFIYKLYNVIQKNKPSPLDWHPKNCGFFVTDIQNFVSTVLPKQFGKDKLQSFVRKLNRYGFQRVKLSSNKMKFSHKYFEYGSRNLQKISLKKQDFIPKHIKLKMMRQQLQKRDHSNKIKQEQVIKIEQYRTTKSQQKRKYSEQQQASIKCEQVKQQQSNQLVKIQQVYDKQPEDNNNENIKKQNQEINEDYKLNNCLYSKRQQMDTMGNHAPNM